MSSTFLSKLFLAASLCLFGSNAALAALSAKTANTVQGTKPKLTAGLEGAITGGNDFVLFGVNDGTNNYFTDASIKNSFTGFNLSSARDTPASLITKFNASNTLAFGTPSTTQATDSDGDIFDEIAPKAAGSVALKWYNKTTNSQLTAAQLGHTFCKLAASGIIPELRAEGAITLKTKYGDPREQSYPDSSIGVTKNPKRVFDYSKAFDPTESPVCYVRPELQFGTGNFAGPVSQWDPLNGFIPQSETIYSKNFPTTGAHNLYFDLVLTGVNATTLTWPAVTVNGITATASVTDASTVKITLTGPYATPAEWAAASLGWKAKPGVSQFVIEGKLGSSVKAKYGFELKKWYINRGTQYANQGNAANTAAWCTGAGYRLPTVGELTNASGTADINGGTIPAVPNPNPNGNDYWRRIGGGLFAEWGIMSNYTDAGFANVNYWTSDTSGSHQFTVYVYEGLVRSYTPTIPWWGVCTF